MLAGPGTGKTTTLVEAVVDRVRNRGLSPDEVLVLTFGRKAATELRDRITGRLGRTTRVMPSMTFHSFCYALLRRFTPADAFDVPLRLPSGPEQSLRLSEALSGSREVGAVHWPGSLHPALKTRGFTDEVQAVIGKARQLGLDPEDLSAIGRSADRAEWVAVGDFFEEYLQILDHEQVLDYSELIHRAVILAQQPQVQAKLRTEFKAVFVDEYQDTDPGQTKLLQAIAGDGRDLVVVGDPDQSIYTFRGADVRGLLRFTDEFRTSGGAEAAQIALGTTRRFGTTLQRVSRNVVNRLGVPGTLDRDTFERFRNPDASGCVYGHGKVEANLYSTSGAELEHIADLLRRAHVQDGVGWSEMAVLVRSGSRSIPPLRRALAAAGIPVDVAGDELPLSREPAVRPMLLALRAVADPVDVDGRRRTGVGVVAVGCDGCGTAAAAGAGVAAARSGGGGRAAVAAVVGRAAARGVGESAAARRGGVAGRGAVRGAGREVAQGKEHRDRGGRAGRGDVVAVVGLAVVAAAARSGALRWRAGAGGEPGSGFAVRVVRRGEPGRGAGRVQGGVGVPFGARIARHRGGQPVRRDVSRGRRTADDGAPVEGAAVAARRRGECAGRAVAGSPAARIVAGAGPARA